ncbi:MAG: histidine kinase [Candidatus Acidiferrales bacterium]
MLSTRMNLRKSRWRWIACIWLGLGFLSAIHNIFIMRTQILRLSWVHTFITLLFIWLPWALATPFVLDLGRKYPLRLRPISTWFKHFAAYASVTVASAAWCSCLEKLLTPLSVKESLLNDLLHTLKMHSLFYLILYSSILLVGYMLDYRERLERQQTEAARLSEQLSKAQLSALRQQIQPHFLFNTLNAVVGLVRDGRNDAAVSMIVSLSDLLLRVLKDSDRQEASLGEELEFLQKYLHIQKMRFANRLRLHINVPEDLLLARVPTFVLQPIVENAVKHGIAKRAQGGLIQISAARSNGSLILDVYNEGPGLFWDKNQSGTGLSNMRIRLQALYGSAFFLGMRNQGPCGVAVSVSVPFREE